MTLSPNTIAMSLVTAALIGIGQATVSANLSAIRLTENVASLTEKIAVLNTLLTRVEDRVRSLEGRSNQKP